MADVYHNAAAGMESPAWDAAAVTPDNGADLARVATRALFIGSPGDITVVMSSGTEVVFRGLAAGSVLPIRVDRVKATGTDAADIVALY